MSSWKGTTVGTISDIEQVDNISCGFYSGYAVYLVNREGGFRPGLPMSVPAVESKRQSFVKGRGTLSPAEAPRYLRHLGVMHPYECGDVRSIGGVQAKVSRHLRRGRAMMWGSAQHWYGLLDIDNSGTITLYDPAGQKGVISTVGSQYLNWGVYLVHPKW